MKRSLSADGRAIQGTFESLMVGLDKEWIPHPAQLELVQVRGTTTHQRIQLDVTYPRDLTPQNCIAASIILETKYVDLERMIFDLLGKNSSQATFRVPLSAYLDKSRLFLNTYYLLGYVGDEVADESDLASDFSELMVPLARRFADPTTLLDLSFLPPAKFVSAPRWLAARAAYSVLSMHDGSAQIIREALDTVDKLEISLSKEVTALGSGAAEIQRVHNNRLFAEAKELLAALQTRSAKQNKWGQTPINACH